MSEERVLELALEVGADDVIAHDDGSVEVLTPWEDFHAVNDALQAAGLEYDSADVVMQPSTSVVLDTAGAETLLGLVDMLEDLDDVQNVYTNADIPDAVLTELEQA